MISLESRLYTTREVAEILHCNIRFVCILIKRHKIQAIANGKMYLFDPEEIIKYLENNKVGATSK